MEPGALSLPKVARLLTAASAAGLWFAGGPPARVRTEDYLPPRAPAVEHTVPGLVREDLEVK